MIHFDNAPQGSDEWLAIRRGRITGSRFKDARDRIKNGDLSAKSRLYAMDVARERVGGKAPQVFSNAAMRTGTEQEPHARMAYEIGQAALVEEAGFAYTDDGLFGVSVDGLVSDTGIVEIKTMVSSETLFRAVVQRDISEYMDQCMGALWLLGRRWCDLCLWAPDLPEKKLHVIRIDRDDDYIGALETDLMSFARTVSEYEIELRKVAA